MYRCSPLFVVCLLTIAAPAAGHEASAQSALVRPPNLSGAWVPPAGVVQFNFLHRFSRSPAPERKVTGFPAFTLATGLLPRVGLGLVYATNSTIAPGFPNEWEFFGRALVLAQASGAPADLGAQLSWNLASEGLDGELTVARTAGRARLIGIMRGLSSADDDGMDVAAGGGGAVSLTRHVALAGDAVARLGEIGGAERVSWSAGLQIGIPGSPHTLSLHASNTPGGSLQGITQAGGDTRFGFEFTIPVTLARYFGGRAVPDQATPLRGDTVRVNISALKFAPQSISVAPGTVVIWTNDDPIEHTVTAADTSFDSGLIQPGASWSRTFDTPGSYDYACRPHPVMRGRVVVERP